MKSALPKGEQTRHDIVEAAVALFHRKGVHWVSIPEIARKVGIQHGSVYRYFDDKDALLLACCERALAHGRALADLRVDPLDPAPRKLSAYLSSNFEWMEAHPEDFSVLLAMYYFAERYPRLKQLHRSIDEYSVARIEEWIVAGEREGVWKLPASSPGKKAARERARLVHSLLVGEFIKAFHWPDALSRDARFKQFWLAVLRQLA